MSLSTRGLPCPSVMPVFCCFGSASRRDLVPWPQPIIGAARRPTMPAHGWNDDDPIEEFESAAHVGRQLVAVGSLADQPTDSNAKSQRA